MHIFIFTIYFKFCFYHRVLCGEMNKQDYTYICFKDFFKSTSFALYLHIFWVN
jgi:hypothetical protein